MLCFILVVKSKLLFVKNKDKIFFGNKHYVNA